MWLNGYFRNATVHGNKKNQMCGRRQLLCLYTRAEVVRMNVIITKRLV